MESAVFRGVDEELYSVLPQFLSNLEDDLEALRQHHQHGEMDAVKRIAHGMKGSAGSFGLEAFRRPAVEIEEAVETADEPIPAIIDRIENRIEQARRELEELDDRSL